MISSRLAGFMSAQSAVALAPRDPPAAMPLSGRAAGQRAARH